MVGPTILTWQGFWSLENEVVRRQERVLESIHASFRLTCHTGCISEESHNPFRNILFQYKYVLDTPVREARDKQSRYK